MKLSRRLNNILICGFTLLYAVLSVYFLVFSFENGMEKTGRVFLLIPLLVIMIALSQKLRIQTIIGFLLLVFWIPIGLDNYILFLFEILLYVILLFLIVRFAHSNDPKMRDYLINFPWLPFILLILGALLSWSLSYKIGGEINEIRATTVLPLALSMVIFLTIQSTADAEHFLWMILTSAAVLGLLFLVGKNFSGFISLSTYALGSGRLSMKLVIPQVGTLEMLPQSTANWFGYLLVFAYSIWIFHPSSSRRAYAVFLCLLYGAIIISSQGRGGALTGALGAVIVSVYAVLTRRVLGTKGIWLKFSIVCLVVIGGFWYQAVHSTNTSFVQHGTSLFVDPLRDENLLVRFQDWTNGINLYLANPILGVGLSGIQTPWGPDTSEVLNYFLLILLGYGLLGIVGILLIFRKLLVAFWRGIQSGDRATRMICIASIGGLSGFFLGMQPEEPYSTVIVWAPLLIAFAASMLQGNRTALELQSANEMK
jgi:hypothetical protein